MSSIEWTDDQKERFWSRVDSTDGPDACWPWTGATQAPGYGRVRVGSRAFYAHRVALELESGTPLSGEVVMHRCDNPVCCNPRHLRDATQRENIADCASKGRRIETRGERSGRAKLTNRDVRAIRARIMRGDSLRGIAADYGVGHTTIAGVKLGKTWCHVQD